MAVVGATASGKTGLSLDLAERLGGEVVNTDAMQVYRGMDVGTAKLPASERRGIPHHLLDTLTVREPATVAEFQGWAREVIDRLRGRGYDAGAGRRLGALHPRDPRPVRVPGHRRGGPRQAGAASSPSADRRRCTTCSTERDPDAAARILPENGRRIVRALEVVELTGRPFSASLPVLEYADPHTVQIGVDIDRETLDERIAARVDAMFTSGFVEEVRHLLDHGLAEGRTAPRAIGYREVVAHLRGELTEEEAREQTAQATRRFARRQDSWFRKDPRIVWIRYDDPELVDKALRRRSLVGSEQDRSGRTLGASRPDWTS